MNTTTRDTASQLEANAKRFIASLTTWITAMDKDYLQSSSSEFSKIKNREYYYRSVDMLTPDENSKLDFKIGGLKIKVTQKINPISSCVTFYTYECVNDYNAKNGIRLDEIKSAQIFLKNTDGIETRKLSSAPILNHADLIAGYLDAVIDYFKNES